MTDHINVAVKWHQDGRTVTIQFDIEPVVAYLLPPPPSNKPTVGPLQLESKDALFKFLADLTRTQPDGAAVGAGLIDDDETEFLKHLGVTGPVPDPIEVSL